MFLIFDHTLFSSGPLYDKHPSHGWTQIIERYDWSEDNSAEVAKGWIKTADSLASLARMVGLDPNALVTTVDQWNRYCDAKHDPDFGRTMMMAPMVDKPFYAIELSPSMLNTQGGPRRNEKGQIVRQKAHPSKGFTARANSVRSIATCTRAPAILGNAWHLAAFPGETQQLKRPGTRNDPPTCPGQPFGHWIMPGILARTRQTVCWSISVM
jgi:FAD binding domain-containing protein